MRATTSEFYVQLVRKTTYINSVMEHCYSERLYYLTHASHHIDALIRV